MAVRPTYPGVYIQEVPSPVRTIVGVSTSVTAFVGYLTKGPMNRAVKVFNFGDFQREFGGLHSDSEVSYAIQQFFLNGGTEAWVIRTATGAVHATVDLQDGIGGARAFTVRAINEGVWGNHLRVRIDDAPTAPTERRFNMTISEFVRSGSTEQLVQSESFPNLAIGSIANQINDETTGSKLIQVPVANVNVGSNPPLQNGTVSGDLSGFTGLSAANPQIAVSIGTSGSAIANFVGSRPTTLADARSALERAIRNSRPDISAFASARVEISNNRLRVLAGPTESNSRITFAPATDQTATQLNLTTASALAVEGVVSSDLTTFPTITGTTHTVRVTIGGETRTATLNGTINSLATARTVLEDGIHGVPNPNNAFTQARVATYTFGGQNRLIVVAGVSGAPVSFANDGTDQTATQLGLTGGSVEVRGVVSGDLSTFPTLTSGTPNVGVKIGNEGPYRTNLTGTVNSLATARTALENAIRAAHTSNAFTQARVAEYTIGGQNRLIVVAGDSGTAVSFTDTETDPTAAVLNLTVGASSPVEGVVSGDLSTFPTLTSGAPAVNVTIGSGDPHRANLTGTINSLATARTALENAIRTAHTSDAFTQARVVVYQAGGQNRLIVVAGVSGQTVSFGAAPAGATPAEPADATTVNELALNSGAVLPVQGGVSGDLSTFPTITGTSPAVNVTIGNNGPHRAIFLSVPNSLTTARTALENAIHAANVSNAFTQTRVAAYTSGAQNRLIIIAGSSDAVIFSAAPNDSTTVTELRLDSSTGLPGVRATANVQEYRFGQGAVIANTAQGAGTPGDDGAQPDANDLIGDRNLRTGMYALERVDIFNLLCIPRTAMVSGTNALTSTAAGSVIGTARNYCEEKRAFFILDTPNNIDAVDGIQNWLNDNGTLRHPNVALYFPRVRIADPLNEFRLRSVGASGTIAGLYARTDSNRGVWKAPAGTEATLRNVQKLDYSLTDPENGTLNPLGINCLRNFRIYGNVSWGARTLMGSDQQASEWKYIPVRRLALFMEESLYRGTQWVVFEPNDEPLWAQIRLNVGSFMHNLFRQGAFQGSSPRDAYFVKCDSETTIQNDIDQGIVNILVGFAPLKPAEFVIIKISQIVRESQT